MLRVCWIVSDGKPTADSTALVRFVWTLVDKTLDFIRLRLVPEVFNVSEVRALSIFHHKLGKKKTLL